MQKLLGRSDRANIYVRPKVFAAERGLGNILSGPISSLLLGGAEQRGHYAAGKYENMVIFIGTCLLASAFGIGGRLMK